MTAKALIEIRDVIHVWIEFRAPKKGELTWCVPADATLEEALDHVLVGRDSVNTGKAGFGIFTNRAYTPEFELLDDRDPTSNARNIVVHAEYVSIEPSMNNIIPHIKRL